MHIEKLGTKKMENLKGLFQELLRAINVFSGRVLRILYNNDLTPLQEDFFKTRKLNWKEIMSGLYKTRNGEGENQLRVSDNIGKEMIPVKVEVEGNVKEVKGNIKRININDKYFFDLLIVEEGDGKPLVLKRNRKTKKVECLGKYDKCEEIVTTNNNGYLECTKGNDIKKFWYIVYSKETKRLKESTDKISVYKNGDKTILEFNKTGYIDIIDGNIKIKKSGTDFILYRCGELYTLIKREDGKIIRNHAHRIDETGDEIVGIDGNKEKFRIGVTTDTSK